MGLPTSTATTYGRTRINPRPRTNGRWGGHCRAARPRRYASRIAGISYETMSRAILPWLVPLLVVLALITGEHFFGIWGALLGVPVLSVVQGVFNHFRFEAMPDDNAPPTSCWATCGETLDATTSCGACGETAAATTRASST